MRYKQIFEWDSAKEAINIRKHHISFEMASLVFNDPDAISRQDRIENGEERWQTIGYVDGAYVLLVAHTTFIEEGDDVIETIRIISARRATEKEIQFYVNHSY